MALQRLRRLHEGLPDAGRRRRRDGRGPRPAAGLRRPPLSRARRRRGRGATAGAETDDRRRRLRRRDGGARLPPRRSRRGGLPGRAPRRRATCGGRRSRPPPPPGRRLFYAGCALAPGPGAPRQDARVAPPTSTSSLAETGVAGCCGHPAAGSPPACLVAAGSVVTACPACDRALAARRGRDHTALAGARRRCPRGRPQARGGGAALRPLCRVPRRPGRGAGGPRRGGRARRGAVGRGLPRAARRLLRRPRWRLPGTERGGGCARGVRRRRGCADRHALPAVPGQRAIRRAAPWRAPGGVLLAGVFPGRRR